MFSFDAATRWTTIKAKGRDDNSEEYQRACQELVAIHESLDGEVETAGVLKLKSGELLARLEFMLQLRGDLPAPSSIMTKQGRLEEYLALLSRHYAIPSCHVLVHEGFLAVKDGLAPEPPAVVDAQQRILDNLELLMGRISALEKARPAPRETPKKTLKVAHPPLGDPSETAHRTRSEADRKAKLLEALERSNDAILGLDVDEQKNVIDFMSSPLSDTQHRQHARGHGQSRTRPLATSTLERRLLPGTTAAETHAGVAATLVSEAITSVSKKRAFGSYERFMALMKPLLEALIHAEPEKATAYYRYQNFLTETMLEFDWEFAEKYHWQLFAMVEEGNWDLEQGPCNDTMFNKLARQWKPKGGSKGGKGDGKGQRPHAWCPLHGWCDHVEAACKLAVANGGSGAKASSFRAVKPK